MKKQIVLTDALLALLCGLILSTGVFAQVKTWGNNLSAQAGRHGFRLGTKLLWRNR